MRESWSGVTKICLHLTLEIKWQPSYRKGLEVPCTLSSKRAALICTFFYSTVFPPLKMRCCSPFDWRTKPSFDWPLSQACPSHALFHTTFRKVYQTLLWFTLPPFVPPPSSSSLSSSAPLQPPSGSPAHLQPVHDNEQQLNLYGGRKSQGLRLRALLYCNPISISGNQSSEIRGSPYPPPTRARSQSESSASVGSLMQWR